MIQNMSEHVDIFWRSLNISTNFLAVGVSGSLIFDIPVTDWVLIGTALLLALNLLFATVKLTEMMIRAIEKLAAIRQDKP